MPRTIWKLTALSIEKNKEPGVYGDGGGLYLRVTPQGTKNWVFRFMLNGRARWMGLGPLHAISLADARDRAAEHRKRRYDGVDPIEHRRAARQQARLEAAKAITFQECADKYINVHKPEWRNEKHAKQWETTLKTYAGPVIGSLSIQSIDTALVHKALEPIWTKKPETAGRLRGRIEAVLDWATAGKYRTGENPARMKGPLEELLPKQSKVQTVKHHAALPYAEVGAFIAELRTREALAARALEFAILTAARTGEVIGARWSEINLQGKVWTVPANRMKAGKEHRVPLCPRAIEILEGLKETAGNNTPPDAFVFPGNKSNRSLSNMAFLMLLRRMGRDDLTAHGFRSTFRDWAAERTNYPREVAEMALAHSIGSAVEAAYKRIDLFDKRRRLMSEWAKYCDVVRTQQQSNIAEIRARR